jgi:hypothetical protein
VTPRRLAGVAVKLAVGLALMAFLLAVDLATLRAQLAAANY